VSAGGARVALVTGATGGIGAACCRALAAGELRVAVHYRSDAEGAEKLVASLGGDAFSVYADLSDPASIDALVAAIADRVGRLDVLVNNAGATRDALLPRASLDDYDVPARLARGAWYLTKLVLRRFLLRADAGRIIQISSVVGHTGNAGQTAYAMAKAGLDALTRSLAQELGGRDIRVNSVVPGFIETPMTAALPAAARDALLARIPLGRMGLPEEVAEVVAFLATRGSYVHGAAIHVNGGLYGG
jgi:3-oxoacyl-[acyl-carrier protein] reductase